MGQISDLQRQGFAKRQKGDLDGAIASFTAAIESAGEPRTPDEALLNALICRALALRAKGQVQEALNDYDEALRLKPTWLVGLFYRGNARIIAGDAAGAIEDHQKFIAKAVNKTDILRISFVRADLMTAITDCSRAISADPKHPTAYFCRAVAREAMGEGDSGYADYEVASKLMPDHPRVQQWWQSAQRLTKNRPTR
jgi:tetratricopeptide (TPR) repeat protein